MRPIVCAALLLSLGCHQPGAYNPVSPTPPRPAPIVQSAAAAPPPFSIRLLDGASPAFVGRWPAVLEVTFTPGVVSPERPSSAAITCPGSASRFDVGVGLTPISCDFPEAGHYTVRAVVTGVAGFQADTAIVVDAIPVPINTFVPISYDLLESRSAFNRIVFGVPTYGNASRYIWDFGDGGVDRTLLPAVIHTYTGGRERIVTIRIVDAREQTLATGTVRGRW